MRASRCNALMSKAAHPVLERLCLEGLCTEREEREGACPGFSALCASRGWFALVLATSSGRMRCSAGLELVCSA